MAFVTVEARGPWWWGAGDGRSQPKKKRLFMRRQMGSIGNFMRGVLQVRQSSFARASGVAPFS